MPEAAALQSYATVTQFRLRAPSAQAFTNTADAVITPVLEYRSRWLDGYLMRKFTLPLLYWQSDLTQKVIDAAAYDIMVVRGYNPDNGDRTLFDRYMQAEAWAKSIPLNTTPLVTDSSGTATAPGVNISSPTVTSARQRGFSSRETQATFPPCRGDFEGD